jgi:cellulose synthase/poly-beta-1,6-N-acetylglucosamine synthase-like glycosyltransferase
VVHNYEQEEFDEPLPLVSIIIPSYNHKDFVRECLESLLDVSYPNLEIILVDDGSRDLTFQIASDWLERHRSCFTRIYYERQENQGICFTLNKLVALARGEFVIPIASDDRLLPNGIALRLTIFEQNPELQAIYGDSILIDENSQPIGESLIRQLGIPGNIKALQNPRTLPMELILRWSGCGPGLMFRRAMVAPERLGPWREDLYFEDREMFLRMVSAGVLRFIEQPVACYRVRSGSMCRNPVQEKKIQECIFRSERLHLPSFQGVARIALGCKVVRGWAVETGGPLGLVLRGLCAGALRTILWMHDIRVRLMR